MRAALVSVETGQSMVGKLYSFRWRILAGALLWAAVPSWGDIVSDGNVSPADPATWTSSTTVYVGNTSVGSVTVNSGSDLLSGTAYLGNSTTATSGTMAIEGNGSVWSCGGDLVLGDQGAGALTILNGGSATVGGATVLGGALHIGPASTMVSHGVQATLSGVWTIDGTQTILSSASAAYMTFATGHSSQALSGTSKIDAANFTITGSLDIKNNALIVEAADAAGKTALLPQIAAMLGTSISSSTAQTDYRYTLVLVDNAALGASFFGGLPVDANSVIVTEALKGDANFDGVVGAADLTIWKAHFGLRAGYTAQVGDFNHDGLVSLVDLVIWRTNIGNNVIANPVPSVASPGVMPTLPTATFGGVSAVPEPASLAVWALGVAGLLTRRRRRMSSRNGYSHRGSYAA